MNPLQIVYAVISVAMLASVGGYIWHCHSVTAEYAAFKDGVEKAGKKAQADAKKKETDDKAAKEKADAENKRTIDALHTDIKRLRKRSNTTGGAVSANPSGSKCPDGQVCYDKAEYIRTDGNFVAGARALADEGSEIAVNINMAKRWAQEVSRPAQP